MSALAGPFFVIDGLFLRSNEEWLYPPPERKESDLPREHKDLIGVLRGDG
jgi:hypothetical protein